MLEKGADVNARDNSGNTALMKAAKNGHADVVQILIAKGANVNVTDGNSIAEATPLTEAISNCHTEVARILIDNGANINLILREFEDYLRTALVEAIQGGCNDIAEILLDKGVDVNAQDKRYGYTALIWAVKKDNVILVQKLIHKGAHVNARFVSGEAALMTAAEMGYVDVVKTLLVNGADVNARTNSGDTSYTALMYAVAKGHREVAELLRKAGAKE